MLCVCRNIFQFPILMVCPCTNPCISCKLWHTESSMSCMQHLMWGWGEVWYSLQFRMGVCRSVPGKLALFQTKETQLPCSRQNGENRYPVPNWKMWDAVDLRIGNGVFEWTCEWDPSKNSNDICSAILKAKSILCSRVGMGESIPCSRQEHWFHVYCRPRGKIHTLLSGASLYNPYTGVPPPPSPHILWDVTCSPVKNVFQPHPSYFSCTALFTCQCCLLSCIEFLSTSSITALPCSLVSVTCCL